jgi:hypothetical protein
LAHITHCAAQLFRPEAPIAVPGGRSITECPHCHERIDVFSYGGGRRTAQEMQVHFLAALPPKNREPRITAPMVAVSPAA